MTGTTGISFEEVGRRVWACVLTAVNSKPATIRYQMTADWNLIRISPDDDGWLHVSHNNIPLINIDPRWIESDRWNDASIITIPQSLADMPADWLSKEQHR